MKTAHATMTTDVWLDEGIRLDYAVAPPPEAPVVAGGPKFLLISHHFLPDATVGAIRPAKFAKYLRRLGWRPYVLTVREEYLPVKDPARFRDVADLPIVRTGVWPTVLQLALALRRRYASSRGSQEIAAGGAASRGNGDFPVTAALKRYLNSLLELPDKQIGWLIPAVRAARRLVRTEGISLVVTSSPPRTTALVGLLLSYLAPIRLVTDLRDPWFVPHLENPVFTSLSNVASSRSWLGDRIERWLERQILERSARVVTATERHARALRSAYPHLQPDRICTITNGYDAEDLEAVEAAAPAPTFTLSYLGTFYFHRTPKPLFEALRQLIRERRFSPGEVQVNLFGDVRTTTDGAVEELISTYGLADCVRVREPVPYGESLRQMMQSHVLLLFAPNQACSVPAKTFEYLAMRRRILCLADEGATADLINQTGAGLVVPPDDVPALKRALVELFDEFKTGRPAPGVSPSRFERGALARRLSDLLQEIG